MRRVSYKSVRDQVAGFLGWDSANLSTDESRLLNVAINRRLQFGWEAFFWPEWTTCQRRTFRPAWNSGSTYAAAAEVIYLATKKYYCSLRGTNLNQPPADSLGVTNLAYWAESAGSYGADNYSTTRVYVQGDRVYYPDTDKFYQLYATSSVGNAPTDTTKWGELIPLERNIDYAQTGETVIGDVKEVWNRNPRTEPDQACPVNRFVLQDNGVRVEGLDNIVWVEFRLFTPSWTGSNWASGSYAVDDQVYYPVTGDYYKCIATATTEAPTDTAKWERIDFPYLLSKYVGNGAYADVDGKTENNVLAFPSENDEAYAVLMFEFDKLERQQQQSTQLSVRS